MLGKFKYWSFLILSSLLLLSVTLNASQSSFSIGINNNITPKDSVVRILAIGNSFSDDAIEHYLYGLAKAGGYKVIIGNLYVGGAPLDLHWRNAQKDSAAYSYRKIDVNGKKNVIPNTKISTALKDENWDYISFQQASPKSGIIASYQEALPQLFNYVKVRSTNPKVKYIWHQTWAYAKNATLTGFKNYDNNQIVMYTAIMNASKQVKNIIPINILVPCGSAIQNARTHFGDVLNRDGYHLELNLGRYTAACTWYESIFKQNVIGNPYHPDKLNNEDAHFAQKAAHLAVKRPFKVSVVK